MPILKKFNPQPTDYQDYDIDFNTWLASFTPVDTISGTPTITVDSGITLASSSFAGGILKVWMTGGINGGSYKLTARATTTAGRIKTVEVVFRVADT